MNQRKPHYLSRYFIKMMLSYCLVIFIGLRLVFAFTTSRVVGMLTEKESRVDRETVQQARAYSDRTYKTVQGIFTRLYMPLSYYDNYSIMDYLNPRKLESTLDRKILLSRSIMCYNLVSRSMIAHVQYKDDLKVKEVWKHEPIHLSR